MPFRLGARSGPAVNDRRGHEDSAGGRLTPLPCAAAAPLSHKWALKGASGAGGGPLMHARALRHYRRAERRWAERRRRHIARR